MGEIAAKAEAIWRRTLHRRSQKAGMFMPRDSLPQGIGLPRGGWAAVDFAETTKREPEAIIESALADSLTKNGLISYRQTGKTTIATKTGIYFAACDTSVGFTPYWREHKKPGA